jgi:transposase
MDAKKRGQPLTFTPEKGAEIVGYLEEGALMETVAALAGLSKQTLYNWLRRGRREESPELAAFSLACRGAMARSELNDLRIIKVAAMTGQWQAAAWRLERKFPDRYGRRSDEGLIDKKVEKRLKEILDKARKKTPPGPKLKAV